MSDETVLVYVRPWNVDQFRDLANRIWPSVQHVYFSEHRSADQSGYFELFYDALNRRDEQLKSQFTSEDIKEIIIRCRLLRTLEYTHASNLIMACEQSLSEILLLNRPKCVLSVTIDSYILDILERLCISEKIKFIGLVPVFLNGYFRVTARGERNVMRSVGAQEVSDTLKLLTRDEYKPTFLKNRVREGRLSAFSKYFQAFIRPNIYSFLRYVKRDSANYHLWSSEVVWRLKKAWLSTPKYTAIKNLPEHRNVDTPFLFVPLQMSPEATVDYWSTDLGWIDYEEFVCSLVKRLSKHFHVVVKEHPNVFGFRSENFYTRLNAIEGCHLIHPQENSNLLLKVCDGVIVCTGSVGFEAMIRGKSVFTSSEIFYDRRNGTKPLEELNLGKRIFETPNSHAAVAIVKDLLQGVAVGRFINDGTWRKNNQKHQEANAQVAGAICTYLDKNVGR